jgi:hypothetical protein
MMATLLLSAAGGALGGAFGGPLGAIAGRAAGAVLGGVLDQRLLGGGAETVDGPRLDALRVMDSREGAPIPRVYGRMRVAGQVIWASRFTESASVGGGGKGAPRVRSYSYAVSLAVALCEGPVERIGRVWADGAPLPRDAALIRLHRGTEDQAPDPLIAAIEGEGGAPAYRGTAYVVFENLDLERFGRRVPQIHVEVFRQPRVDPDLSPEIAPPPSELIRGVALSPGSGEFALDTIAVRRRLGPGRTVTENVNSPAEIPDALAALDQLQEELPACGATALVVSWFGDDLRCGRCRIEPRVEQTDKLTEPVGWSVNGLDRAAARPVGRRDGRPVYGGTPSDGGVVRLIREMRDRGLAVMFYPFILMDVAPDAGLPDPYGAAAQQPYPWRGRITLEAAPGRPGSPDGTAEAEAQVAAFFGAAKPADFRRDGDAVRYVGPEEWGLRRFILHYAHLCALAGGVDSFCIGSEMRGLTWIRGQGGGYPAVQALRALAADVRAILGPDVKIGYAADWSEYFGHHPADGSGDAVFHLDPLWADPAIDFVGIDNYMPLADWRDGEDHLDAAAGSIHSLAYLRAGVEGGEGFDWYYASDADRIAQRRTPITDGAHGEPWVWRYKDIRSWWSLPHHDRRGGQRSAEPTAWVPMSKPIWFTEFGCPAVDKGANQPNVFHDPKSSESALPWFSDGAPDPHMQRRYLQAVTDYWADAARNPVSPVYGGPMVRSDRCFAWTWDLRPWPDFPLRMEVWADGDNHRLGHWLTGRMASAGLAETVAEICHEAGVDAVDVSALHGVLPGYQQAAAQSARAGLQPLMLAFGFDAVETGGAIRFTMRGGGAAMAIEPGACVAPAREGAAALAVIRGAATEAPDAVRLGYLAADGAYETATAEARFSPGIARVDAVAAPLALEAAAAAEIAGRWLAEARLAGDEAVFAVPPSAVALQPGDVVAIPCGPRPAPFRVERIEDRGERRVLARRTGAVAARTATAPPVSAPALRSVEPVAAVAFEAADQPGLRIAVWADPWPGPVAVMDEDGETLSPAAVIERSSAVGTLLEPAAGALSTVLQGGPGLLARFIGRAPGPRGGVAALLREGGVEILRCDRVEPVAADVYRLANLLRGLHGTEGLAAEPTPAGAVLVMLDEAVATLDWGATPPGGARRLRCVAAHLPPDHDTARAIEVARADPALRPLSVAHLRADRAADGAVTLRWIRRTREGGDAWGEVEPPLAEEAERYRIRVMAEGRVLRVADATVPAFTYTAAMRSADAPVGPLTFAVSQLSARVGPGAERRIVIDAG